ncbi:MAG: hypothetical protein H6702_05995 [Myxococcales bacterium]|nr:hypothetical protein [Myxococcales bacterium]
MAPLLAWILLAAPPPAHPPVEALLAAHGLGAPERTARLDAVAQGLADRLGGTTPPDPRTASGHLRWLMQAQGLGDAVVYPFTLRHRDPEEVAPALTRLVAQIDRKQPPTHLGVATRAVGDEQVTAVVLVHRGVRFDAPLPRSAPLDTVLRLSGDLRRGYYRPRVVVQPPTGPIRERPAWTDQRRLEVNVYLDAGPGAYGVEVLADSVDGPVVLVNHPIHAGEPPPSRPTVKLAPEGADTAEHLLALVQGQRAQAGLPPLRPHDVLVRVAGEHAVELAASGRLTHRSADTGTLRTRLKAAGLGAALSAENLAQAPDAHAALEAFRRSPGHARNLLLPQLTHAGVARAGAFWVLVMAALPPDAPAP